MLWTQCVLVPGLFMVRRPTYLETWIIVAIQTCFTHGVGYRGRGEQCYHDLGSSSD